MKQITSYKDKHVLVIGMAKSGAACAKLLMQLGAVVTINDAKERDENPQADELEALGAIVVCGAHPLELLEGVDAVIKNPGIPYHNALVAEAVSRGISVVTEIELASLVSEADLLAITGSNGKTTTTTLVHEMLQGSERTPLIAGNIGTVACEVAAQATEDDVIVLEVSSFQLLGTERFQPKVAVWLNVFDAHLDYHGDKESYIAAKSRICANMSEDDYLVYNADDEHVTQAIFACKAKRVPFSVKSVCKNGAYIENNQLRFAEEAILPLEEVVLPGFHNLENVLAAVATAKLAGAKNKQICHVLKTFPGVKHRLQFVKRWEGRLFYNDSKATNMLATEAALSSFEKPVVLLAGGLDRGNEFDELIPYLKHVKALVTFGETKKKLARVAKEAGVNVIQYAERVEDAVTVAVEESEEGDVLLLSPACASWDQYRTFEERGDAFISAIEQLTDN
ncbi:UDP-N-acetylmuramoyl-L-alanine--D-glutamate ligase [Shouchella shacheensis]|uniref:UDP-N-acetylmuramoyl-L-alanine--D-glutamate ligase n=1 Tax=Shouchella shacheensis TaxID=1649580 RepID=UPI00073FAA87|nr:UDP-N-acetylmuramoyl-L-alanine--D-glutamate ligase [Shouchella shacheensis]